MSTTILPPLVLIGAEGAGKHTVGKMLTEIAGYKACPTNGKVDVRVDQPWKRAYVISNDKMLVSLCLARGFRVVYVYTPPMDRYSRLLSAGRLQNGDSLPDDHGPTALAHNSLTNLGTKDELREELADLLSRIQS